MDIYENYKKAALAGGLPEKDVDAEVARMKEEDAKLASGFCPKCDGPITKTEDPRQAGPTQVAGKWFNYRCTQGCGWFGDKCEPVGEN